MNEVQVEIVGTPAVTVEPGSAELQVTVADPSGSITGAPQADVEVLASAQAIIDSVHLAEIIINPVGEPGPEGPPGPAGPPGGGAPTVIEFPTPSAQWTVDLGRLTHVIVRDSAGRIVEPGGITYTGSQLTLDFSAPFSGNVIAW